MNALQVQPDLVVNVKPSMHQRKLAEQKAQRMLVREELWARRRMHEVSSVRYSIVREVMYHDILRYILTRISVVAEHRGGGARVLGERRGPVVVATASSSHASREYE